MASILCMPTLLPYAACLMLSRVTVLSQAEIQGATKTLHMHAIASFAAVVCSHSHVAHAMATQKRLLSQLGMECGMIPTERCSSQ